MRVILAQLKSRCVCEESEIRNDTIDVEQVVALKKGGRGHSYYSLRRTSVLPNN